MKRLAILLLCAGLFAAPGIKAQPQGDTGVAAKADEEAQNETGMLGWKWANFALLAVGLIWLARKYGNTYFSSKTKTLNQELSEARRQSEDARLRSSDVQLKLANIDADVEKFRAAALAEQSAEMERMRQRLASEVEATWSNAVQQIETLGKNARLDLRRFASNLALDLAEQKLRQRMNPAIQATLTNDFVQKLNA